MFIVFKILAVIVGLSGFLAFVEPNGGFFIMPITISIGALIFALACMFEKLIDEVRANRNDKHNKPDKE